MALVFTQSRRYVWGDRHVVEGKVSFTGATSYVTGGISTAASDYGLNVLDVVDVIGYHGGGVFVDDDSAGNVKLKLTTTHGGTTEIANAGDPTPVSIHVRVTGI